MEVTHLKQLKAHGKTHEEVQAKKLTLDDFKAIVEKCRPTKEAFMAVTDKESYEELLYQTNLAMKKEIYMVQYPADAKQRGDSYTPASYFWLGTVYPEERDQEVVFYDRGATLEYVKYDEKGIRRETEGKTHSEMLYDFREDAFAQNPAIKDFIQ